MIKNQKGFTRYRIILGFAQLFLIVVVVIIGIGGLLYFSWQKGLIKTTPPPNSNTVYNTQEQCEKETDKICAFQNCDYIPQGKSSEEVCGKDFKKGWVPTEKSLKEDKTVNWKTYSNPAIKLSFEYPSSWLDAQTNILSTRNSIIIKDGIEEKSYVIPRFEITSGTYYNQTLQREMTLDEFIESNTFDEGDALTSEKYEIGNLRGYRYSYLAHGLGYFMTSIILANPDFPTHLVVIVYRHDVTTEHKSEIPKNLDQILSTFKFTN